MSLKSLLEERKYSIIFDLMLEHAGRCKAVGKSFYEASIMLASGNKTDLKSRVKIIKTEERSADEVEAKLNLEVAKSNIPSKLAEELVLFVRTLDRAAGASKRAVTNLELISDYKLPTAYTSKIEKSAEIIKKLFEEMEKGIKNINDIDKVKKHCQVVNDYESEIDRNYTDLKQGYFEIERAFNSSAALIILDHAFRDLEAAADFGEDAADRLLALVSRRG